MRAFAGATATSGGIRGGQSFFRHKLSIVSSAPSSFLARNGHRFASSAECPLTADQRSELMKTAATCPIHRALKGEISVRLRAK
jgi:hypothetical protein